MQNFDSFQLNEQTVVHGEVETQWFVKNKPFILHANYFLRCNRNRTQFQLAQQTSLVNRFDQPWSFVPVDFDCRSDDPVAEAIRLRVQWMHRREFLQKGTKETKIVIFGLKPFVIFVDFCESLLRTALNVPCFDGRSPTSGANST